MLTRARVQYTETHILKQTGPAHASARAHKCARTRIWGSGANSLQACFYIGFDFHLDLDLAGAVVGACACAGARAGIAAAGSAEVSDSGSTLAAAAAAAAGDFGISAVFVVFVSAPSHPA